MYLRIIDEEVIFPYTYKMLQKAYKHISFPQEITPEIITEYNMFEVVELEVPDFDSTSQYLSKQTLPTLNEDQWEIGWDVVDMESSVAADKARKAAIKSARKSSSFVGMTLEEAEALVESSGASGSVKAILKDLITMVLQ